MSTKSACAVALGWLMVSGGARVHGQPETHTLVVNDARPLAAAALQLENAFALPVNYEDVPIKEADQKREVASEVQNAAQKALNPRAKIWVPKGGALTLAFSVDRATKKLSDPTGTLHDLVAKYNATGPHQFQVDEKSGRFSIRPAGQAGSVLGTRVSVPLSTRNAGETLQLVLDQVGRQVGTKMGLGAIPIRLFITSEITEAATNEPAVEVIARILAKVAPDRAMSYQLLFDPGLGYYLFNTHVVAAATTVGDGSWPQATDPAGKNAGQRTQSPWFKQY